MTATPLVFDAESLVAHADDEPGAGAVADRLAAVADGDRPGYVSRVTLAEVRYVLARKYDRDVADDYLDWLLAVGVGPVGVDDLWREAAGVVVEANPALGDAFALATADHVDGTLLVGADDDYDDGMAVTRFRDDPA